MKKIGKIFMVGITLMIIAIVISFQVNETDDQPETNIQSDVITVNDYETLANSANLILGDSNSQVSIMAFLDYQCLDCKSWYLGVFTEINEKLLNEGKINMKFINSGHLGNNSILAAEAVYCANDQGKFPQYQEKLFLEQQEIDGAWLDSIQLKKYAQEIDLEIEEFSECLDSRTYQKKAQSNIDESKELGIERVPVFIIINSEGQSHTIKGGVSYEIFEKTINSFNN
jgi:protein-disulfide isomerase